MTEFVEGHRAFASFRVLNGDGSAAEREQLFRNMAQLFSFVSAHCDDDQVAQYDEALCQLAALVEVEARAHVAKILAPLDRAPGTVVLRLASDVIEVARPLLEFSAVLSDDDLIDIVARHTEDHRIAIAKRAVVHERVGEAIVSHGETPSVVQLVRNPKAEFDRATLTQLVKRAKSDSEIAADLRGRSDIDWKSLRDEIDAVADKVLQSLGTTAPAVDPVTAGKLNAVIYNRMRNRAGFNAQEWKVAYNQVKGLEDRRQLNERALTRFARFGYGHHAAATIAVMLRVAPEIVVKWLASQDYVAITVALRASRIGPDLFDAIVATLPWRDLPTESDKQMVQSRFKALDVEEAVNIFELWRAHSFRKKTARSEREAVSA
ncbi:MULTISPECIES: DUF2336 domain-containing protein [Devosia]|uniref:DUF2336 domain-containing protein n=1 Tax=Devosia equisanguinis TaxID=2490941 RepID=A0A3S4CD60_9HYPH|nr:MULTISPECIES: DUF2336 domain-containing protein [Devosia]ODT50606.1 MAG: hypothetical protein ABS74_03605 [Pelagibacterium sp. SCN 63-126]ODU83470.1 MAG: hypothetical protein ABT14_15770 [Pelagibacterium sp. SCN 63-17]OJX45445.1 MAG: hypothetical protein BGO80_06445 [Devosia sp. 63-57]VDS05381.1 hypothetical protein DEVEQU_02523 [Devosia equisanguinis]